LRHGVTVAGGDAAHRFPLLPARGNYRGKLQFRMV
jgi:hypothetical protein